MPSKQIRMVELRSHRWRWALLAFGIAAGTIAWWLYHGQAKDEKSKRPSAPITIAPIVRQDVPVYLTGLGTVQAYNSVTVHSRIDGELLALNFTEGQDVHEGDVLAQLDARTFQAQYDQALATKAKDAAQLANARRDLARYKFLGDSIARQTLESQESLVKQLEATVEADTAAAENAGVQLSYATITSPINGRTGIRQVDVGNIVHAGDTNGIVVVTQVEPITVLFSLPQQHLPEINAQLNQGKTLTVDALASDNSTVIDSGELVLVDNQIDATTGTIKLKSTFPNHDHKLWPGGFTNIRLLLTTNHNTITIPTVAIQRGPHGAFVFTFTPDTEKEGAGTVAITPVTVGITNGDTSEILSGLTDSDKVVTDGMAKLQDKSKVRLASTAKEDPVKGVAADQTPEKHDSETKTEKDNAPESTDTTKPTEQKQPPHRNGE